MSVLIQRYRAVGIQRIFAHTTPEDDFQPSVCANNYDIIMYYCLGCGLSTFY